MARPALDDLIILALEAGREIMRVRNGGFETISKLDGSPVTIADRNAEEIIELGLARLAPGVPVIGEEAVASGRIPEPGPVFFCVDPLDGTKDFIAGGDEFTVNIALIENGAPMMGVVLSPTSGTLYAGEPGRAIKGVFNTFDGAAHEPLAPINPSRTPPLEGWRVIASRRTGLQAAAAFLAALGPHTTMRSSSSIKFCVLAEGAADLYPRIGDVNEWDAAAGHAILSAAGGGVMNLEGAPIRYGGRNGDFLIHGFVAFASAAAASAARSALGKP